MVAAGRNSMIIAAPRETAAGERRVALVPDGVKALVRAGHDVRVQRGAGGEAGFDDGAYEAAGAKRIDTAEALLAEAELVLKVEGPSPEELRLLRPGSALVAMLRPLDEPRRIAELAERRIAAFSLELLPRITRAQSMDVLSSQATVAGYRAVIVAAERLPKMFPMLVTAAGTISPARVFVIGAGVAGLQAVATARRLGAVVEAYDTRDAAAEQVESLGARFVSFSLETADAEDAGGYARAQSEEFYAAQREFMGERAASSDIVITTALVPGRRAPLLLDEAGVHGMKPGSVVVDLAAPNGGNCACTEPGRDVLVNGVCVMGPANLASEIPADASRMFSRNVVTFVLHLTQEGSLVFDLEDEITRSSLVTREGEILDERVCEKLAANAASGGGA